MWVVLTPEESDRLDRVVARGAQVSRKVARVWIGEGRVSVGGKVIRIASREVRAGREVRIDAPEEGRPSPTQRPSLEVVFEDRHVVVVDKPAGLLSERDRHQTSAVDTVVPTMLRGKTDVWLVHRLDAMTSGVMVLARSPAAARHLGEAFRRGRVGKMYLALCQGELERSREVNAPIGREKGTKHAVRKDGKPAATRVDARAATHRASLVVAAPRTGRTHQIRVHLSHLGHPLLGDRLYGGPRYTEETPPSAIPRAMLHAWRLQFSHPKTGERMRFETPPPQDFSDLAESMGLVSALGATLATPHV